MAKKKADIWFVRHGQSESNANMVTQTPEGTPLTPKGHQEAQQVAEYLAGLTQKPSQIIVSSYHRAQQTAVYTQQRYPNLPTVTWPIHEFTYLAPVRYAGTCGDDRAPIAQAYWQRNDPQEKENGEGESFAELLDRVQHLKQLCLEQTRPLSVAFSHGLFLRAFLWALWMGTVAPTPDMMRRYRHFTYAVPMPNCAILRVSVSDNGRFSLTPFDTSHLQTVTQQAEVNVD